MKKFLFVIAAAAVMGACGHKTAETPVVANDTIEVVDTVVVEVVDTVVAE